MSPYNFQDRLDLLGPRHKTVNGVAGTYVRPGVGTIDPITLAPILAEGQEFIPGVAITQVEFQDFAIDADAVDFGSGEVKPLVGDYVTFQGNQYRLVSRGAEDPPFKYTTSSRKRIRVFTELMGTIEPIPVVTPEDIPGLVAWFDGQDLSTITEVGGYVSQWDDKSGNDYHLTQALGSRQPFMGLLNGRNALAFGVHDQRNQMETPALPLVQPYTCFAVLEFFNFVSGNLSRLFQIDSQTIFCQVQADTEYWVIDAPTQFVSSIVANTDPNILRFLFNDNFSEIDQSGTVEVGDAGNRNPTGPLTFGATSGSTNCNANIGEVLFYNGNIAGTDREALIEYLEQRWGLS